VESYFFLDLLLFFFFPFLASSSCNCLLFSIFGGALDLSLNGEGSPFRIHLSRYMNGPIGSPASRHGQARRMRLRSDWFLHEGLSQARAMQKRLTSLHPEIRKISVVSLEPSSVDAGREHLVGGKAIKSCLRMHVLNQIAATSSHDHRR